MASENTTLHQFHTKDSKLKRAVTFFKHLRSKNCLRHKRLGPSPIPRTESFDTWLAKRKGCEKREMEDTSPHPFEDTSPHPFEDTSPSPMELAANHSGSYNLRSSPKKESNPVYEKESKEVYEKDAPSLLEDLPQYTRVADIGLESYEPSMTTKSMGAAGNSEISSTGIGDHFHSNYHDTLSLDQILVSPISANRYPLDCQIAQIEASLDTDAGLVSPTSSHASNLPSSKVFLGNAGHIVVHPALSESLPSPKDVKSLCDTATSSSQMQVEELREVVRILNEEWMQRCQTTPDLVLHPSALPPKYLFEMGVQILQQIFRGILPQTFEAIFALAHITCASIYIIHGADKSYCWTEFFQYILRWQHFLPNKSDAQLYIRLVNLLWWPQGSPANLSCGNYFLDRTSGTLVPLRSPALAFDTSSSTETEDLQLLQGSETPGSISVLNLLKEESGLRECSILLDSKLACQHPLVTVLPEVSF